MFQLYFETCIAGLKIFYIKFYLQSVLCLKYNVGIIKGGGFLLLKIIEGYRLEHWTHYSLVPPLDVCLRCNSSWEEESPTDPSLPKISVFKGMGSLLGH